MDDHLAEGRRPATQLAKFVDFPGLIALTEAGFDFSCKNDT